MQRLGRRVKFALVIALGVVALYVAFALGTRRPILAHTLGEWDCACGDMLTKTTRRALWNPLRDRNPEIVGNDFLAGLRDGRCEAGERLCTDALSKHRVSDWKLAYREDADGTVAVFFKLTKYENPIKYGSVPAYDVGGVGVVDLGKRPTGWVVTGYDCYF
jgi:hypothetical protein